MNAHTKAILPRNSQRRNRINPLVRNANTKNTNTSSTHLNPHTTQLKTFPVNVTPNQTPHTRYQQQLSTFLTAITTTQTNTSKTALNFHPYTTLQYPLIPSNINLKRLQTLLYLQTQTQTR